MQSIERFSKVLRHIEQHLDEELSIATLSAVAALSPYHFQRQFSACYGIGVFQYIRLLRLQRASFQLAYRDSLSIGEVSADAGYQNAESFARTFRRLFGQAPTMFRREPDWQQWHDVMRQLQQTREQMMNDSANNQATYQVEIRDFPETQLAVLEHRGPPEQLGKSIQQFIAWRRANRLPPSRSATFNLIYDDPAVTAPEDYRFDLGAAVQQSLAANDQGIVNKTIPACRCAVVRHIGHDQGLAPIVRYLYQQWLPASDESPLDFPLFFQRLKFFPDVPEHQAVTEVFLPLR
ncbi:AraC family transcriptional regulator [Permianibacter aggregans]|uniref:AraC family transcriptional regulator n=1 Tax=Permianibacter aggregans TaxID=1510150 RepID=A0A4R6UMH1_9GAMM|nr:AraC family transcriptional regulator [Permianibacter aggregans]QGX40892.1 helix-turn-helix domain-containing protein [Permianibacter aggregans]TDQ48288.1 AraC family transcriptional regulator [Permianibacter aggregans]